MSRQITTPLSSFSSKLDGRSGNISLGLNPLLPRLLVQRKPPLGDCIGFSHGEPGTNHKAVRRQITKHGRSNHHFTLLSHLPPLKKMPTLFASPSSHSSFHSSLSASYLPHPRFSLILFLISSKKNQPASTIVLLSQRREGKRIRDVGNIFVQRKKRTFAKQ